MKHLHESILSDENDILDDQATANSVLKTIKGKASSFIRKNCDLNGHWSMNHDGTINIRGDIYIHANVTEIPILFYKIKGDFEFIDDSYIDKSIRSLKGCPKIVDGNFDCGTCNNLTSLEGAPEEVTGRFVCHGCGNLVSLEGAPKKVNDFYCGSCKNLRSLKGAPKKVRNFQCVFCDSLTTLEGGPENVSSYDCCYCKNLISLKGCSKKLTDSLLISGCLNLISLEGIPKEIKGSFFCDYCTKLKSLKELEIILKDLYCQHCPNLDLKYLPTVKGEIKKYPKK